MFPVGTIQISIWCRFPSSSSSSSSSCFEQTSNSSFVVCLWALVLIVVKWNWTNQQKFLRLHFRIWISPHLRCSRFSDSLPADPGHVVGDAGVDVAVLPVDLGQQLSKVPRVQLRGLRHLPQLRAQLHPGHPLRQWRRRLHDVHYLHLFDLHLSTIVHILILPHLLYDFVLETNQGKDFCHLFFLQRFYVFLHLVRK